MEKKFFMIVDDDEDDRFFFKEALAEIHFSAVCCEANNGVEALEQLHNAEKLFDFIFLDVNMPLMNGRECLKEIKKDAKLKNSTVIMYSTSFSDLSMAEFLKLGASSYLNKPTDMSKLPAQLLEVIKGLL